MHVHVQGGKHFSPVECQWQRRARTLSRPPPCMVEQPQACSICRSFIGGFRCKSKPHARAGAGAWSGRQAPYTGRVPAAETSTHLESASALHGGHGGPAASLLTRSVGASLAASVANANHIHVHVQVQVHGLGCKHSQTVECQRQRRARTLSRPPPCAVDQPQACSISRSFIGGFRCKSKPRAGAWCLAASTLHRSRASGRDEHAP